VSEGTFCLIGPRRTALASTRHSLRHSLLHTAVSKQISSVVYETGNGKERVVKANFLQPALDIHELRVHIVKPRCRTTARKTFFLNRIIDEWNRLPQYVIDSSSVNVFKNKNRLDETWEDMGIYTATLLINYKYR